MHRLREREPVTWFAEQGVWLVTSKALFDELQMDPERFVVDVPDNPQRVVLGRQMLVVDGEEHARHRGPFAEPFKYSAVRRQFTGVVADRVEVLLDAIAASGGAELGAEFANPFAVSVASDVLGLGLEQVEEVHDIYRGSPRAWSGIGIPMLWRGPFVAAPGWTNCWRRASRVSVLHLTTPCSPPAIRGEAAAWRTREELLANLRLILFGAIETVESMILNTTWALLSHPDQAGCWTADPDTVAWGGPGGSALGPHPSATPIAGRASTRS